MGQGIIIELIENAAILMLVALIYDTFPPLKQISSIPRQIASGILIGCVAIGLMMDPVVWDSGTIFDTRTILLSIAGLFFGTIPTVVAVAVAGTYRLALGGGGMLMGLATIFASSAIGLAYRHYRVRSTPEFSHADLRVVGILVHATMILCMFLLPHEIRWSTIKAIALPVMTIYPLGTMLLGNLLVVRRQRYQTTEELRDTKNRLQSILDNTQAVVYLKDSDGRYLLINKRYEDLFSVSRTGVIGKTDYDVFPRQTADYLRANDIEVLKAGKALEIEERVPQGEVIHDYISLKFPIPLGDDLKPAVCGISTDITQRKRAEMRAQLREGQLQTMYDASQRLSHATELKEVYQVVCEVTAAIAPNDGFVLSAFDNKTQLITCRAYYLGGVWIGVDALPEIPLEDDGQGTQSVVIRSGKPLVIDDYQARVRTSKSNYQVSSESNGVTDEDPPEGEVTRSALIVPLKINGVVTGALQLMSYRLAAFTEEQLKLVEALSAHIASAEKNAFLWEHLVKRKDELQQLYVALQSVREDERRSLARELHDDIGHRLTIIGFDLDRMEDALEKGQGLNPERFATIRKELDNLVDATRRITEELRPGLLDSLGLVAAIESFTATWAGRTGIDCKLITSHSEIRCNPDVAINLFRITQESLNNAAKYSGASRVDVSLHQGNSKIQLVIADNGVGISANPKERRMGYGLHGIGERVSLLKGELSIVSQPNSGVRIEVAVPA